MSEADKPRRNPHGLPALLHEELHAPDDGGARTPSGERLIHSEASSRPIHPHNLSRSLVGRGCTIAVRVDHDEAAQRFIDAPLHEKMHDERLWDLRQKRDRQMQAIPEWEELREVASRIKEHTLTHLDQYLEEFEAQALANGIHVHWAEDGAEHNRIVHGIFSDHHVKLVIKSKSMLTEETGFRHYMSSVGIEVIETDLGERIQQLDDESPSHIVVPAVHKLRSDVAGVFARTLGYRSWQ